MRKNKSYSKEFKFKVAIEMLKGDLTIAEIVSRYQVPRSVLAKWKRHFLDCGPEIYKKGNKSSGTSSNIALEKLHATIGRLKVENDFLHQASEKLQW